MPIANTKLNITSGPPIPTPTPIVPGTATGTNPVLVTGAIVPISSNTEVARSSIPEKIPTPVVIVPRASNTTLGAGNIGGISTLAITLPNANTSTSNITNIYNTYLSNVIVYGPGDVLITNAVQQFNFTGSGITVTGGGIVTIDIPGATTSTILIQGQGNDVVQASTVNFVGNGITTTDVGGVATVTVNGLAVQDKGFTVVASPNRINFVGNGVVASNLAGVATVTISGPTIQDEGTNVLAGANRINFVGSLVSASNISNVATVTISGPAVQDEGSNVVASASTINFVGNGVSTSNVGNVATVSIVNSGIAVQDEGANVVANAGIINFVGNGVLASNVGGIPTVTIDGGSGIAVQDEGTNVVANANTINFVGNGVAASNVGGVPTITITSSGIQGVTIQEEGTNVLTTANTINFVGSSVTASNVGNVATITISGGNTSNISNGTSNVSIATSGGNVTTSVNGNANILVVTGTGANINGYANISGNLSAGNLSIGNIGSNLIPTANVTYDLGNATYRWKDLYLSDSTIYLGPTATLTAGSMTNGNSNVSIPVANGNIIISVAGNANIIRVTGTGANIGGYANVTGNVALSGANVSLGAVGNLHITGGSNGQVLSTNGSGGLSWVAGGSNTTAGGSNTQIQFNDDGNFGGNTGFTFTSGNGELSVPGNVVVGNATGGNLTGANVVFSNSFVSNGGNVDFATNNPNVKLGNVANIHIGGGNANFVLTTDGAGNLTWAESSAGNANVAGSNTQVQFNDAGVMGANANLTFDKTTGNLTVGSNVVAVNFIGAGANTPTIQSGTNLDIIANAGVRVPSNISMTGANVSLGNVTNVHITGGTGGQLLRTDGTGNLSWVDPASGGNAEPAGQDKQLQYNEGGAFGATSNLTFDYANSNLYVGNINNPWLDPVLGTARGNLFVRGNLTIGSDTLGDDTEAVIRMIPTTSAYGFTSLSAGILAIVNEEASLNQAIILTDTVKGNAETIFGVSTYFGGNGVPSTGQPPEVWEPVLDVRGNNFFVPVIASAAPTANALFFNPANGRVTYGTASGIAVQEEGANVVTSTNIMNFVGVGVTASNVAGVATITINGGGEPGGANTQIQYNDDGVFGGNPAFTFDEGTTLITANNLTVTSITNLGIVGNVHIDGGTNGQYLQTDGAGNLTWSNGSNSSGNGVPGGANSQIQYNDNGDFGGNPAFTFDEGTTIITANNLTVSSVTRLGAVGNVHIDGGNANFILTTDGNGTLSWSQGLTGIAIQEEGTNVVATANTINFVGNGVTVTDVSGVATVTVDAGTGNPAGTNMQVQYNDNGVFGANAGLTFEEDTTTLTANNFIATSTANLGDIGNVTILGGNNGYFLQTDGTGTLTWAEASGNTGNSAVAGANTQIQFNDAGNFGAAPGFTFNKTSTTFTANNIVGNSTVNFNSTSNVSLGAVANVHILGGNANFILTTDGTGNLTWANLSSAGNIAAAGANTQVQYNDDGVLGGSPAFTFDEGTTLITANNLTVSSVTRLGAVSNVHIDGGTNGYVLQTDGAGNLSWTAQTGNGGGNGSPAGADTQIQYNDAGAFGGNPAFTFNEANSLVTANNLTVTSVTNLGNVGNVHIDGGSNNFVLTTDGNGTLRWGNLSSNVGNIKAGGANTQVQYNDDGVLGGNPAFTFDEANSLVTANNFVATSTANLGNVGNVTILGGNANFVLTTNGSGVLSWANVANGGIGNIKAGGSNTQIQYNDNGVLGGNPAFTFDEGNSLVTANNVTVSAISRLGDIGNVKITGGTALQVIATADNDGTGNLGWATLTFMDAGGSNTQVQYNDDGILGGNPGFTFDEGNSLVTANNFVATSTANLGANANVIITGGSAGQALTTDGSGNLSWSDFQEPGGYYLHTQSVASNVWTVTHNLNKQYLAVEPVDGNNISYNGRYDFPIIDFVDANTLIMTWESAIDGYAAVVGGGVTYTTEVGAGITIQSQGSNVVANANTMNFTGSAVSVANIGGVPTVNLTGISGITVLENAEFVVTTDTIGFTGPLVSVANVPGNIAEATVGMTVKSNGTVVTSNSAFGGIDFVGGGVSVSASGNIATVTINGGGGGSSALSAPFIRVYTGNATIRCTNNNYWYPIPLDNSSIVNTIGAVDYINGTTYLPAGTYYFESTVYLNCTGSDTLQGAYVCLIANPSISLDPILGTSSPAPAGTVLAKAGVTRIGDYSTTPIMGIGTFTIASATQVSLAFSQYDGSPQAWSFGDEFSLGYNTTILKLWKTA